jgi:hypothetical protein
MPEKPMIGKILEVLTGKDDMERVAAKEDLASLRACLRTRTVFVPKRPRHFLDAASFTEAELLEVIRKESEEAAELPFEAWILEVGGQRRLPIFSSRKRMEQFSKKISKDMNKVFALMATEALLYEIPDLGLDFADLNLFCESSREIPMRSR